MAEYKEKVVIKGGGIRVTYIEHDYYEVSVDKFKNPETQENIPFKVRLKDGLGWVHTRDGIFKDGVPVNYLLSENLNECKSHFDSEMNVSNYM